MAGDRMVFKTALSLATIATSGLIRLVFSLLIGHIFGPAMLGHANVLVSATMFATLLCSPGLGQSVARQLATRDLAPTSAEGRFLLVRATLLHHAMCIAIAVATGLLVPAKVGIEQVLVIALTMAYGAYTYYKAILYGADLVRRYARLEFLWDGFFLASLLLVVILGTRTWVLAPMVVVYGGFSVGAHRALFPSRRRLGPRAGSHGDTAEAVTAVPSRQHRDDRPWWRAVGGFALVTTLGTASSAGFLQLSQIFAMRAGGEHGAGLFAAALSLVTPAYLLPRAISVVLFPAMARAAGRFDSRRVTRQLQVGTQVLAAALLPLFAVAGVLAGSVLVLAYGREFADGSVTLTIMVWATWVSVASVPAVNALSSDTGRGYLVPAAASIVGFAVGMAIWFAVGHTIEAVAWGYFAGSVVQSAVPMVEAARRHRVPSASLALRAGLVAALGLWSALEFTSTGLAGRFAVALVLGLVAAAAVLPELRALRGASTVGSLR